MRQAPSEDGCDDDQRERHSPSASHRSFMLCGGNESASLADFVAAQPRENAIADGAKFTLRIEKITAAAAHRLRTITSEVHGGEVQRASAAMRRWQMFRRGARAECANARREVQLYDRYREHEKLSGIRQIDIRA